MNDYKELINKLRNACEWCNGSTPHCKVYKNMQQAADAIEQLVTDIDAVRKERDELKSKIFDSKPCLCCRHTTKSVMLEPCASCNSNHDNWEWRGVTDD